MENLVGKKVKIISLEHSMFEIQQKLLKYLIGEIGFIEHYNKKDKDFTIRFENGEEWYFNKKDFELL